ncbi:MAG: hypothetical protein C0467_05975 [Planctomycetaceae bacterium]|nr:hypothetical protein [Planctomycetaceae bacterium]
MVLQTVAMGQKKKPEAEAVESENRSEESRKPFKPARIRAALAKAAEQRAAELAQDFTQYVNDSVRMRLESEGHWPPKPV